MKNIINPDDNFNFLMLLEDSTKTTDGIESLMDEAEKYFDGKSNGKVIKKISRQWLIQSKESPFLELLNECELNWNEFNADIPKFIIKKIQETLRKSEKGNVDLAELFALSNQLTSILKNVDWYSKVNTRDLARSLITNLGNRYFVTAINVVYEFAKVNLPSDEPVPKQLLAKYKKIKAMAYFLAYAGSLLIIYKIPENNFWEKSLCRVCFRRTELGSASCKFHRSDNANHDKYLLGRKILKALKVTEPEKYRYWEDLKKDTNKFKLEEFELNLSYDKPVYDLKEWTKTLISFIKSKPVLGTRLSIEKIEQFQNWVEVVDYLRNQLENPEEKSNHPLAVTTWLALAADWFEFENMFVSKEGNIYKKAKGFDLPPRQLFLNEFLKERNFDIDKITLKFGYNKTWIKKLIYGDKELLEIYLENQIS